MKFSFAIALTAAALAVAPAFAHHSYAMFDIKKNAIAEGTIKEFQFTNPHIFVDVEVPNGKNGMDIWSFESVSVSSARRLGWKRNIMKSGDKVKVYFHPMRDGSHGGSLTAILLPDGTMLGVVPP